MKVRLTALALALTATCLAAGCSGPTYPDTNCSDLPPAQERHCEEQDTDFQVSTNEVTTPTATVQGCVEVAPSADEGVLPPSFDGSNYDGPTGAWTAPDGTVLGWSDQEDSTVWNLPGCEGA